MKEIMERRSYRQFEKTPVTAAQMEALFRAAMAAPSAGNQQPWQFVAVTDPQIKEELSRVQPWAGPCAAAPLVVALLADLSGAKYPAYWQQDLAAATENLLLEAVSQKLGAVWMGIAPEEDRMAKVAAILQLPAGILPFALVAVGTPIPNAAVRTPSGAGRYEPGRIFAERYGCPLRDA